MIFNTKKFYMSKETDQIEEQGTCLGAFNKHMNRSTLSPTSNNTCDRESDSVINANTGELKIIDDKRKTSKYKSGINIQKNNIVEDIDIYANTDGISSAQDDNIKIK